MKESGVRFAEIFDGEIFDATFSAAQEETPVSGAVTFDGPSETLIPQEGEEIREQDRVTAARIFITPKGESVVDFGQNLTGYVQVAVIAEKGEIVDLSFAEVLDNQSRPVIV